jgi:hypothetical protein
MRSFVRVLSVRDSYSPNMAKQPKEPEVVLMSVALRQFHDVVAGDQRARSLAAESGPHHRNHGMGVQARRLTHDVGVG